MSPKERWTVWSRGAQNWAACILVTAGLARGLDHARSIETVIDEDLLEIFT